MGGAFLSEVFDGLLFYYAVTTLQSFLNSFVVFGGRICDFRLEVVFGEE
jgi:hypothetical protein